MRQLHLLIHGKVQGVFYRDFVKKTADSLELKGWVRNNPNETVEVVAEGEEEKLKKLLEKCKDGPAAAKVDDIGLEWRKATGEFDKFSIIFK